MIPDPDLDREGPIQYHLFSQSRQVFSFYLIGVKRPAQAQ
jgi:hypothetical protein